MAGAYRCPVCGIDFPSGTPGAPERTDSGAADARVRPAAPPPPPTSGDPRGDDDTLEGVNDPAGDGEHEQHPECGGYCDGIPPQSAQKY